MNTAAIIDAVATEGGFDSSASSTSRTTILGWVQEVYDEALRDSGWRKVVYDDLGPTVANQGVYGPLADHVVDVRSLQVDGSEPYVRCSIEELWFLKAGNGAAVVDAPGAFAPSFSEAAAQSVEIWPAPTEAGLVIQALVTQVDATALADSAGSTPALPADLHRKIFVHGAVALGLTLVEGRDDLAASHEQRKVDGIAALKKRASSRIGSGPTRIRMVG